MGLITGHLGPIKLARDGLDDAERDGGDLGETSAVALASKYNQYPNYRSIYKS